MGEVVPARTSPTLPPHPLALCCNYPVSKCPSASIVATSTLRVNTSCDLYYLLLKVILSYYLQWLIFANYFYLLFTMTYTYYLLWLYLTYFLQWFLWLFINGNIILLTIYYFTIYLILTTYL